MSSRSPLSPYLAPDDREARLELLTARAGGRVVQLGASVEGRPLRAAVIPARAGSGGEREAAAGSEGPSTPKQRAVLCTANIHGPELISAMVALGLLERLGRPDRDLERLRRRASIWIIPCLNPDGYARTWRRDGQGRLAELRPNANGVDLNRNFPLPAGTRRFPFPGAGSPRPGSRFYRGSAPLSEPETAAVDQLLRSERFVAGANLHSFMGFIIPARVTDRAEYRAYRALCRQTKRAQPRHRYPRLAFLIDTYTGEMEDYQHHTHGCWAVCVETFPLISSFGQHLFAPSVFWRFNPRDPGPWVENDVPALCAYFHAALDLAGPASK